MTPRIVWFVAGSVAGIYGAAKAKRAAYRLSAPGVVDQAAALGEGWRAFSAELHDGMRAREHEIARRLSLDPTDQTQHQSARLDEAHLDLAELDPAPPDKKAN